MKRLLVSAAAVVSFFAAGTLFAQRIQATVPFDFYVGQAAMSAGTYDFERCSSNAVVVRSCTTGNAVLHYASLGVSDPLATGKVVFHRYGETYFLSAVQGLPSSGDMKLPASALERKIKAQGQVRTYEKVTVPNPAALQNR